MQIGQYIYYKDTEGNTCPGKIIKFSESLVRAQISYNSPNHDTDKIAWVLLRNIEPQLIGGDVYLLNGTKAWVARDCVEYKGESVYRFEPPCACYPIGNATMTERGRIQIGGADDCPVHGFEK